MTVVSRMNSRLGSWCVLKSTMYGELPQSPEYGLIRSIDKSRQSSIPVACRQLHTSGRNSCDVRRKMSSAGTASNSTLARVLRYSRLHKSEEHMSFYSTVLEIMID
jgi:hypothetical protein